MTEIGQKARVERSSVNNDMTEQLREVLRDIGRNFLETGTVPKGMKYCGSLSVHVYTGELTRTFAAVTLSNHDDLDFTLADSALRELTGTTHESFGRKRQKLRSGF